MAIVKQYVSICMVLGLSACSSSKSQDARDSIAALNEACAKVRDLNRQVEDLHLDEKSEDALNDPKTKELLDQASKAAGDLASQMDAKAKADGGKLGQLRRTYEQNKELIADVADFAKTETTDSAKDKVRRLRKISDIIGADNCANTTK